MNVEIGTEAAQFPEKEYINVIFLAVCEWHGAKDSSLLLYPSSSLCPHYLFLWVKVNVNKREPLTGQPSGE